MGEPPENDVEAEHPSPSSSPSTTSNSPPDIAVATDEASNKHSSNQGLLLQSVDWLEDNLLSGITETPSIVGSVRETSSLSDNNITSENAGSVSRINTGLNENNEVG